MNLEEIKKLSAIEKKTQNERFIKLSEECGELAQEILIKNNASGFKGKSAGNDGIKGECVDIIIVAISIFFQDGGTVADFLETMEKKCLKWKSKQDV